VSRGLPVTVGERAGGGGFGLTDDAGAPMVRRRFFARLRRTGVVGWVGGGSLVRPALLLLGASIGWGLARADAGGAAGWWLWASAVFLVGLPHGAYDLAAMRRQDSGGGGERGALAGVWRGGRGLWRTARRFGVYTALTVAALSLLMVFPAAVILGFLLLSAYHFGVSDAAWTRGRAGLSWGDRLTAWGQGGLAIFAPVAVDAAGSLAPFGVMSRALGGELAVSDAGVIGVGVCVAALAALGWGVLMCVVRDERDRVIETAGVVVGIVALALLTPPLVAVGVYFVVVHAGGHCWRACVPGAVSGAPGFGNAWRVHAESLLLLLPSVAAVFAASWLAFGGLGARELALGFLLFCVVGTPAHHALWSGWLGGGFVGGRVGRAV